MEYGEGEERMSFGDFIGFVIKEEMVSIGIGKVVDLLVFFW